MDHEAAFDKLTQQLDPYHEFLRFGHISALVEDPDEWRAELRRQARRDKIPFHSFVGAKTPAGLYGVYAGQARVSEKQMAGAFALMNLQCEARSRALLHGHTDIVWVRVLRGVEAAGFCRRCHGRVYVSRNTSPPVIDGDVFESDCSD